MTDDPAGPVIDPPGSSRAEQPQHYQWIVGCSFGVGRGSASDRSDCPVCLAALPPRGHCEEGDHWTKAEAVTLWV